MEKRVLLAFVLSIIVFVGWSYLTTPSKQESAPTTTPPSAGEAAPAERATTPSAASRPALKGETPTAKIPVNVEDIVVKTDLYEAKITPVGGRLKSLTLNNYRVDVDPQSPPKELVAAQSPAEFPLATYFRNHTLPGLSEVVYSSDREEIRLGEALPEEKLTLTWRSPEGFEVIKTFTFRRGTYLIDMAVTLRNLSSQEVDDALVLELTSQPFMDKHRYSFAGLGLLTDSGLHEIKLKKLAKDMAKITPTLQSVTWAAYEDQYFLAGILPAEPDKTRVQAEALGENGVRFQLLTPPVVLAPDTEKTYRYTLYYGPKDYKRLKALENGLVRSIYFGWLDVVSKPLLVVMLWLNGFLKNYGLTIILLTVVVKILFWPLTAKSYKSMKQMQKLQPQIMKLREKYKNDREAMNREMMQLYRTFKVNPMGGCLPMVIQIPVFIAFYRLLDYSLELRHAPFWLWIQDLSAPDRLLHFGFKIPYMQEPAGIPVLTLLMGASMFLTQKMTPTPGDPTQAKIMMLMPIFFTVIFVNFPSGLVLYWFVNNLLSLGQQYLINKRAS